MTILLINKLGSLYLKTAVTKNVSCKKYIVSWYVNNKTCGISGGAKSFRSIYAFLVEDQCLIWQLCITQKWLHFTIIILCNTRISKCKYQRPSHSHATELPSNIVLHTHMPTNTTERIYWHGKRYLYDSIKKSSWRCLNLSKLTAPLFSNH